MRTGEPLGDEDFAVAKDQSSGNLDDFHRTKTILGIAPPCQRPMLL
jgi:hypothetical protein